MRLHPPGKLIGVEGGFDGGIRGGIPGLLRVEGTEQVELASLGDGIGAG
jgi:hypothetical protein